MDHLPMPKDRHPFDVSVPYVASGAPLYDKEGWSSFPSRLGLTTVTGIITCQELSSWPREEYELQAMLQSWMYFGLLDEVFGDLDAYRQDDFIAFPPNTSTALITTTQLLSYIVKKQLSLKLHQNRPLFRRQGSLEMDCMTEVTRIKIMLNQASRQINEWDWFAQGRGAVWANLVLSVRLLVEALYYAVGQTHQHLGAVDLSLTASVNHIRQHILSNHWCTYQFDALCTKVSFTTLVYVANIRRDVRDHSRCRLQGRCVGFNTDLSSFTDAEHVTETCNCEPVSAPKEQLIQILRSGGIPVLSCRRKRSGQLVDVRYIRASPGLHYAAISHLWADGLGNPNYNRLPNCQLTTLLNDIQSATPEVARYGYFGMALGGTEKLAVAFRAMNRAYHNASRHWQTTTTVNIWLDVYCIPVISRSLSSTRAGTISNANGVVSQDFGSAVDINETEVKALKTAAIRRMDATYSWANYTLILDRELRHITPETDETEFLARLGISAWNSRCWTFQEHSLAQVAAYRCKNGVTFQHVPYGDEPEQMIYWSIARPPLPVMLGLTENLERLALPTRIITGGTYWTPSRRESWRSTSPALRVFVDGWNNLVGRNTTMSQDLLCIFANLLGLSSSELLKIEIIEDQMRAILAAQEKLPLSLLFVETGRMLAGQNVSQTGLDALQSRWIPTPPFHSPLQDRSDGFDMTVVSNGLLLVPAYLCLASNVKILRIKTPAVPTSRWIFDLDQPGIAEGYQEYRFWISIDPKQLKLCQMANPDTNEVIAVLDISSYSHNELSSESFVGTCLLPTSVDAHGREAVVYICPVRWGIEFSSRHGRREQMTSDDQIVEVEIVDGTHVDILITSDIKAWPRLMLNRNKIERGYSRRFMRIMRWLCIILAVCCVTQVPIGILLGPGYIGRMALTSALSLLPSILLIGFIASIMDQAHKYMLLYSMQADFDPSLEWWDRLEYAITLARADSGQFWQMIQLNILLVIGRGGRRINLKRERMRKLLNRRADEGSIALP